MPINKNAIIRYHTLDKCFRNTGRMYFIEDLLEECNQALSELNVSTTGIKRRQLFEDIRFMKSEQGWSIPLERYSFGRKFFYRYDDKSFSITNQPLNDLETEQIKSALFILSHFKGMPQFEWVSEIIPKIETNLNLLKGADKIISFDANEYLKGVNHLGELFNSILYKKALIIEYKSFKSEVSEIYQIHPYYLKQYNNRWFLFAYNANFSNLSNLALDRILSIKETTIDFIENIEIDFDEYFEDIIGVTKPNNSELIKLELFFTIEQSPYIITKPIHGSQKTISNTMDGLTISIEVIPNYELERLILSFVDSVKVLKPDGFRERIIDLLSKAMSNY